MQIFSVNVFDIIYNTNNRETEIDAIDVIILTETEIMVDRHLVVDHEEEEEDVTTTEMVLHLPDSSPADHLA
jgi:hypothetical protein